MHSFLFLVALASAAPVRWDADATTATLIPNDSLGSSAYLFEVKRDISSVENALSDDVSKLVPNVQGIQKRADDTRSFIHTPLICEGEQCAQVDGETLVDRRSLTDELSTVCASPESIELPICQKLKRRDDSSSASDQEEVDRMFNAFDPTKRDDTNAAPIQAAATLEAETHFSMDGSLLPRNVRRDQPDDGIDCRNPPSAKDALACALSTNNW